MGVNLSAGGSQDGNINPNHATNIYGGTFTTIEGNQFVHHNNHAVVSELGLQRLREHIAVEAMHNSKERFPAPSCHPGTREEVLQLMKTWISNPLEKSRIFWLKGAAGVGKSAIMQDIANLLLGIDKPVAASFFFGRGKGRRELGEYLFPTIVYQLAINTPELRGSINSVVDRDPTALAMDLRTQFQSLISEPLQGSGPISSRVILIDGLDECRDHETQRAIVDIVGRAMDETNIPLRFIIASRPELQITTAFGTPHLERQTHNVSLDDDFSVWHDIRKYYEDTFQDIRKRTRSLQLIPDLPKDWPGQGIIGELVWMANGQFVFAATAIRFIDDPDRLPTTQLAIILNTSRHSIVFSHLDNLYTQILSARPGPNPELMKSVLGVAVGGKNGLPPRLTVSMIGDTLQTTSGEILLVVQRLRSILKLGSGLFQEPCPLRGKTIEIIHTSFRDYLIDPDRSGAFHCEPIDLEELFVVNIFTRLSDHIQQNIAGLVTDDPAEWGIPFLSEDTLNYFGLAVHLDSFSASVVERLRKVAATFQQISQGYGVEGYHHDMSRVAFHCLTLVLDILGHKGIDHKRDHALVSPYTNLFSSYMGVLLQPDQPLGQLMGRFPEFVVVNGNGPHADDLVVRLGLNPLEEQEFRSLLATTRSLVFEPERPERRQGWTFYETRVSTFIRRDYLAPGEYEKHHTALVLRLFSPCLLTDPEGKYWDFIKDHYFERHLAWRSNSENRWLLHDVTFATYPPVNRLLIFEHLDSLTFWHPGLQHAPNQVAAYHWDMIQLSFILIQRSSESFKIGSVFHTAAQNLANKIYTQVLFVDASGIIALCQPIVDYLLGPVNSRLHIKASYEVYLQKTKKNGVADDNLPTLSPLLFLFNVRVGDLQRSLTDPAAGSLYVGTMEVLVQKVRVLVDFVAQPGFENFEGKELTAHTAIQRNVLAAWKDWSKISLSSVD